MFLIGLGTAVPEKRFTQRECYGALQASEHFRRLKPRSRALLRKVLLGSNGIESRHLSLASLDEALALDPETLHARYVRNAPALANKAAARALAQTDGTPDTIDAVVISTCTGCLCPGLSSYVAEGLGLRSDVLALDLVGQGCGAALPNWRTAEALLAAGRARRVLSVCVEVCSAAVYLDDDPGVIVSACLFGDGAGAAVLSARSRDGARRIEWRETASVLRPEHRDLLRFEQRGGMLRNILTVQVPELAAQAVSDVLGQALKASSVSQKEVCTWVAHAGGRDVLNALQHRLALSQEDLRWSAEILRDYGNLSSASVYFALERALAGGAPSGWWWLCSFGAGFSCHGALLRVD